MNVGSLPRSYIFKKFRYNLNDMCYIEGLKGNFPGAKVSSVEIIMAVHIFGFLQKYPGFNKLVPDGKLNVEGQHSIFSRMGLYIHSNDACPERSYTKLSLCLVQNTQK